MRRRLSVEIDRYKKDGEIQGREHAPRAKGAQYKRLHIGKIQGEQEAECYDCLYRPESNRTSRIQPRKGENRRIHAKAGKGVRDAKRLALRAVLHRPAPRFREERAGDIGAADFVVHQIERVCYTDCPKNIKNSDEVHIFHCITN